MSPQSQEPAGATSASGAVRWSVEDGIGALVLDRPPLNILDTRTLHEMQEALTALARDPALRAVVVRGEGKAFCAGVDIEEHRGAKARPMLQSFHRVLENISNFAVPTIAVMAGAALGGGFELAMACDIRIVAREAKLGLPEVNLGVFPPYACVRLPELVGYGRAAQLILTGGTLEGETAHHLGLAEMCAPREQIEDTVRPLLAAFHSKSASTLRLTKEALRASHSGRGFKLGSVESLYLDRLMKTHDAEEGLRSFIDKRTPEWKHR